MKVKYENLLTLPLLNNDIELVEIGKNMENQRYKTKYFFQNKESCKCVYMSTMTPLKRTTEENE